MEIKGIKEVKLLNNLCNIYSGFFLHKKKTFVELERLLGRSGYVNRFLYNLIDCGILIKNTKKEKVNGKKLFTYSLSKKTLAKELKKTDVYKLIDNVFYIY